jgi:hypothetical protein
MSITSPRVPLYDIRRIVDQYHVSAPTTAIVSDMLNRMRGGDWTTLEKTEAINYALQVHQENQTLYTDVMSGNI